MATGETRRGDAGHGDHLPGDGAGPHGSAAAPDGARFERVSCGFLDFPINIFPTRVDCRQQGTESGTAGKGAIMFPLRASSPLRGVPGLMSWLRAWNLTAAPMDCLLKTLGSLTC